MQTAIFKTALGPALEQPLIENSSDTVIQNWKAAKWRYYFFPSVRLSRLVTHFPSIWTKEIFLVLTPYFIPFTPLDLRPFSLPQPPALATIAVHLATRNKEVLYRGIIRDEKKRTLIMYLSQFYSQGSLKYISDTGDPSISTLEE